MSQTHILKTWPTYWDAVERGDKTFEVRINDRSFQKGDVVTLRRLLRDEAGSGVDWPVVNGKHQYRDLHFTISYVLQGGQFGIEPRYCVLGLKPIPEVQP